jgi:hypothetical protein
MNWDWSDFKKPHVLIGVIVAVLGSAITGGAVVWFTVMHQIPELAAREDKQDKAIDDKFAALGGSVDKQFTEMHTDVSDKLNSLGLKVNGLQTNVILLCGQKRPISRNCDVKALVAEAKRASQIQAEYFASAEMKLTEGSTPMVADEGLKRQLPDYIPVSYMHADALPNSQKRSEFASQIIWSSAADSARWHQEGNSIVVVFANGRASFDLSGPTTKEHVGELVQSLNTTTEALKAAGATPDKK